MIHGTISILGVGTICILISDTYSFYGLTSLALITWWSKIQIIAQNHRNSFFIILTGFLIGFSNTVRGNSGTDVLISIICILIFNSFVNRNFSKLYIIILILLPVIIINFQISILKTNQKIILRQIQR